MTTSNWDKFCLLMWKNWRIQWHRKGQLIVEILMPVIFTLLLVLVRTLVEPEEFKEPTIYKPEKIDNLNHLRNISRNTSRVAAIKKWEIAYTPDNELYGKIVSQAAASLNVSFVAIKDAAAMEKYVANEKPIAGIQFLNTPNAADGLLTNLTYALRFPSELRSRGFPIQLTWQTNHFFPIMFIGGPRNKGANDGGAPPGYIREGFIAIQNAIAVSFIKNTATDSSAKIPQIQMQRYPYPPYIDDMLLQGLESFVPLIILLSFIYACKYTVKSVTEEKELQLKEVMKIMGLSNWIHWTAWFVKSFMLISVSVLLITIIMKLRWIPDVDVAVLTHCDFSALLFFLLIYAISNITFCFALSTFFKKSDTASAVTGLVIFLSYMPFSLTQMHYETLTLGQKLGMSIFFNTAMSFGFKLILQLEGTGEGLQWSNMWKTVSIDDEMHVGHMVVMLLVSAVLHMTIALYVEQISPGEFGIARKWYFPFTREFWFGDTNYTGVEDVKQENNLDPEAFETEASDKWFGLQIRGLRKVFKEKVAVKGLTMDLCEDEITVLLGHNGAGKTTTISMLTGMFPPTSGTAVINGSDIRTNMKGARMSLGLCPQHNILFSDLTVEEHIIFYSRLKGVEKGKIDAEIKKYVNILELEDKIKTPSSKLSGGMKRKLSVGVALCGGSKVVLLDEPTSGMDPAARRSLWNLVQQEKKGRTILLSTHFMDEADVLGDRIAIMGDGELKCFGTSFFLKKKFGFGYHLICVKGDGCNSTNITNLLSKYVPDIQIESEIGAELSYQLPERYASVFEEMLKSLEESSTQLKLTGYGISNTTLEEVFMAVGAENASTPGNAINGFDDTESLSAYDANMNEDARLLKGPNLVLNQWRAMLSKKFLYSLRNLRILFVQNIMPIFFIALTITVYKQMLDSTLLPSLEITLDSYDETVTVLEKGHNVQSDPKKLDIFDEYKKLFQNQTASRQFLTIDNNFEDYILSISRTMLSRVNSRYLVAATIAKTGITAWFNNQAFHTAPLSLNLVHNAIARSVLGSSFNIEVINSPLPLTAETRFEQLSFGKGLGFQISLNLSFCMAFVSAFYILFIVKERESRAKLLQFVGGVRVFIFWMSTLLWDLMTYIITALVVIITLACFQEEGWSTPEELGRTLFILLIFGLAVMPFTYIAAIFCKEPVVGFSRLSIINIFTGMACFVTVFVMGFDIYDLKDIANSLTWFFMAFPHFSLAQSLNNINVVSETRKICEASCELMPDICQRGLQCILMPQCCSTNYYSWEVPGIGRNIVYMLCTGGILFLILMIKEYRIVDELLFRGGQVCMKRIPPESEDGFVDEDVRKEKERVKNMSMHEVESHNLVLDRVTKYYGDFLAVNQVSVGVLHSECFGLLGVNGAGKTSTFKMMTGDERITNGEAYVKGISLQKDMNSIYSEIGYCPQFDALLEELTGRETMRMFCLLRGIPSRKIDDLTKDLAKLLGFSVHLDKEIRKYSGGNKRKLSTAIALIGSPSVIYLDEPTTGMDPAARRQLWNMVCRVRDSGKSIVLTSHSMEECEALCTRLAIMVNGEFKCMGSTQHLKNRFSKGFVLKIKLKKRTELIANGYHKNGSFSGETIPLQSISEGVVQEDIDRVKSFIESQFSEAVLREQYQSILTFYIPLASIKWSRIFGLMEKSKKELNIEDYSLTQTTLEQIFLEFAKYQREDYRETKKSQKKFCNC